MVSVCMATYNGEKYIKEQLESILPQLQREDEIIISDDGSNDNTLGIIDQLKDPRIKVFSNPEKGVVKNFENALKKATGDFIFLSDQDDIWKPSKVKSFMDSVNEGFDLIISDCETFDSETNKIISPSFFKFNNSRRGLMHNFLFNNYIGCCMGFSSKVKDKVLPFPPNIPMHDSWIGLVSEAFFNVKFEDKVLLEYRIHGNNASATGTGISKYSILEKLTFRYSLAKSLFAKILRSKL